MSLEQRLRAALEAGDDGELLELCAQLDSNISLTVRGYDDQQMGQLSQSVAHHVACKSTSVQCLQLLIDRFGSGCLTCKNSWEETPVQSAAEHQDESWMRLIRDTLGKDCFRAKDCFGRTAAHYAASNTKSNSALKFLVDECGSDCLLVADKVGDTPVHAAAQYQGSDSMELIARLIGKSCFSRRGCQDQTAAHRACMNLTGSSALQWLLTEFGSGCLTDTDPRNPPSHIAAEFQDAGTMELIKGELGSKCLLELDGSRQTAVHRAAINKISNSAFRWLLCEFGPECLLAKDRHGCTPIMLAAQFHSLDSMQAVKDLLLSQSQLHQFDSCKQQVMEFAAVNTADNSAFKWLVSEFGSECLIARSKCGDTPVHLAAERQTADSLQFALDQLASEQIFCTAGLGGCTVSHKAAMNPAGDSALLWCVRRLGPACLLVEDLQGATAAHLAARHQAVGSLSLIKDVLGAGVLDLLDKRGCDLEDYIGMDIYQNRRSGMLVWLTQTRQQLDSMEAEARHQEEWKLQQLMRS